MNAIAKAVLIAGLAAVQASIAIAQSTGGPARGDDRLVCRRLPETGSLVKARRQCFTKAQWDEIAESQRRGASRMIDELTTKPGGN